MIFLFLQKNKTGDDWGTRGKAERDYVFDLKEYKLYIDAKDDIQCVGRYLTKCKSKSICRKSQRKANHDRLRKDRRSWRRNFLRLRGHWIAPEEDKWTKERNEQPRDQQRTWAQWDTNDVNANNPEPISWRQWACAYISSRIHWTFVTSAEQYCFPKDSSKDESRSHFFLFEDFRTIIKPERKATKPITGTSALYHARSELLRRMWTYLTQGSRLTSILWHASFSMVSSEKAQEHRFLCEKKNIFFPERLMAQRSGKDRLQKLQIFKKAISANRVWNNSSYFMMPIEWWKHSVFYWSQWSKETWYIWTWLLGWIVLQKFKVFLWEILWRWKSLRNIFEKILSPIFKKHFFLKFWNVSSFIEQYRSQNVQVLLCKLFKFKKKHFKLLH